MRSITVFIIAFSILCCHLTACSVSERISYEDDEGLIPSKLLKKIKRKKTEKSWVIAHLGEPYTIDRVDAVVDHHAMNVNMATEKSVTPLTLFEVYTYRFTRSQIRSGHVLFFLKAAGRKDDVEYFHVAFDDDLVQKSWMDKYPRAQLGMRIRLQKMVDHPAQMSHKKSRTGWRLPSLKKWFSKKADASTDKRTPIEKNTPIQAVLSKTDQTGLPVTEKTKMMQSTMQKNMPVEKEERRKNNMESDEAKENKMESNDAKMMEKMSPQTSRDQKPVLNKQAFSF